jgi:transposase-like protein
VPLTADQVEAWCPRRLDPVQYLFLDVCSEKVRDNGVLRDAAILLAIGIGPDGRRNVLGVSCVLSEDEVHDLSPVSLDTHLSDGDDQRWQPS